MSNNEYVPFPSEIKEVIKHTDIEYTFRMTYEGEVRPGQFFEVSIPKFGEAPISVSGIQPGLIDLTIRKVGKVTDEIFETYKGHKMLLRGPYGNGFDLDDYRGKELIVVAGGTGVSPVRGVVDYFATNPDEVKNMIVIAGFKSPKDILFCDDFECWKETTETFLTVDDSAGDDTYQEGLVTEYIPDLKVHKVSEAVAIVVGPPMMMKFSLQGLLEVGFKKENIWISHERKMCCGLGKCGHCRINNVYVCLDGPVFNYASAQYLID